MSKSSCNPIWVTFCRQKHCPHVLCHSVERNLAINHILFNTSIDLTNCWIMPKNKGMDPMIYRNNCNDLIINCLKEREEKTEDVERMKTKPKNANLSSKRTDRVCTSITYIVYHSYHTLLLENLILALIFN